MGQERYYRISEAPALRPFLRSRIVALAVHWVFQGMLYMDWTERLFKVGLDLGVGAFLFAVLTLLTSLSEGWALAIACLTAHTLNFLLNGQVWVVLKHFGGVRHSRSEFERYLCELSERVRGEPSIRYAAAYGSLARREWQPTSDLDVRLVRRPRLCNALRACGFALHQRSIAFLRGFPLDIYVLDNANRLAEMREDEPPLEMAGIGAVAGSSRQVVIVHPMDSLHPQPGGGIRYLMNALSVFLTMGWQVTVLGYRTGEPASAQLWHQESLSRPGWVRFLLALYTQLPLIKLPDEAVIVAHRMDCMLPFVLLRRRNPKVLVSAAPMHYLRLRFPRAFPVLRRVYQMAERICLSGVDLLVPVDPVTEAYYLQRYPGLAARTTRIPSGVDLQQFALQDQSSARKALGLSLEERIVLFVGRLAPVKNVPFLIRAFAAVQCQVPSSRLLIVGGGEAERSLKAMVHDGDHITFTGAVEPDQICLYLNAADVLALCSLEEGSPTVVKEALACGLPVVSTDVGDVCMVLSSSESLGEVVGSSEAVFTAALVRWVNRGDQGSRARAERRRAVELYDTKYTLGQLVNLCNDFVGSRL